MRADTLVDETIDSSHVIHKSSKIIRLSSRYIYAKYYYQVSLPAMGTSIFLFASHP